MSHVINIKTADLAISHNDDVLKTGSIGSCVVIAIYDEENRIGGLAHAMLPTRKIEKEKSPNEPLAKYANEAVDNLVNGIIAAGGNKDRLVAKLVGGASMFSKITRERQGIGASNVQSARERLSEMGINIASEDTGGGSGKIVEFDLRTGIVQVNTSL